MEVAKKQQEEVATDRKGMTTRSRRRSSGESAASKFQKVADGDQATKGKVKMARVSQEYIDALLRLEKNPIRPLNVDILEGYTGPVDVRGIVLRCNAAREEMEAAHANILQQYSASCIAYTEVVDKPGIAYTEVVDEPSA